MTGNPTRTSRRSFLKAGAAAGGGLLLGFRLPITGRYAHAAGDVPPGKAAFEPNAWIRISKDDQVTIIVSRSEMGQGVMTAMPMLVAEELDADWERIATEFAPADKAYTNPLLGRQVTGGSTSVRAGWQPLREAGAAAKEMLVAAAAQRWGVKLDSCKAGKQVVRHPDSGRQATYGELAEGAAEQEVPQSVMLKHPSEFRLLGTPQDRLDAPAKVDGSAVYGMDVSLPGLLTAQVVRCPVFGGSVKDFDASAAKQVPGVKHVFEIESGIAVVAEGFWPAQKGREALKVEWDFGDNADLSHDRIERQFREALDSGGGAPARSDGDVGQALDQAGTHVTAEYEVPFLAHACMEPMNCTARIEEGTCEVWAPTQNQTGTQQVAAQISGVDPDRVQVHTTFLGGGFGRRSSTDFVADAVETAKKAKAPVKVIWTREDTTRHGRYRPATFNRLAAAVDDSGKVTGWRHRIAGPSIMGSNGMLKKGQKIDSSSVEVAKDVPYGVPNIQVDYAMSNTPVPVWWWRSVGGSQNGFIREAFFDEVAAAAGKDPYELRRSLLQGHARHLGVLELAARQAGWGGKLPKGRARGIAVVHSFGSYCAEVAEVSVDDDKKVRVHRVDVAIDCGQRVNPEIVTEQMQSGVAYGLSAALQESVTVKNGRVQQSNFDDYHVLRMDQMPEVHVHIVDSDEDPGGIGEPGTPPIAPAVANAIFAVTGQPVRRLPLTQAGYRPA